MTKTDSTAAGAVDVFSTALLRRGERFSYWADVVAKTFVALECDTPDRHLFSGSIRHRSIGRIGISDVSAAAQCARRTQAMLRRQPSDSVIAVIQISGICTTRQGLQTVELSSGQGAAVGASEPYSIEFGTLFRQLVLKLPRQLIPEPFGPCCPLNALSLRPASSKLLQGLALAVLDEPVSLSADEEDGLERVLIELLRTATLSPRQDVNVHPRRDALRYAAALRFIEHHLTDPDLDRNAVARISRSFDAYPRQAVRQSRNYRREKNLDRASASGLARSGGPATSKAFYNRDRILLGFQ